MKRLFIVILLMLLLSIVFLVVSGNGISYKPTENITEISPFLQGVPKVVKLYFISEDQLISNGRTIIVEELETELAIIKELKLGSKVEAYMSPIDESVSIISVKTTDRICYVNLSNDFLIEDVERLRLNVMGIVNTLTELEFVDSVQILVDGKRVSSSAYTELSGTITRNTTMVQTKELNHKDVVVKFQENILKGRYDLAYEMIDSDSKQYVDFEAFRERMLQERNKLKGFEQRYVFAKRENGQYIIQMKYVMSNYVTTDDIILDSESPIEVPVEWAVIKEKGVWKVKYHDIDE